MVVQTSNIVSSPMNTQSRDLLYHITRQISIEVPIIFRTNLPSVTHKKPEGACQYKQVPSWYSRSFISANVRLLYRLCVNQLTPDNFLGAAGNVVRGPDPVPLRASLQVLSHTLGIGHLFYDKPIAVLGLLVQVGKIGVQFARQDKVIE